jgi:hypothetical protein
MYHCRIEGGHSASRPIGFLAAMLSSGIVLVVTVINIIVHENR